MATSPDARGFRMPAEWARHEATWMAWPHDPRTWVASVDAAEAAYEQMIAALVPGERVELIVHDVPARDRVQRRLQDAGLDTTTWEASPGVDVAGQGLVRLHAIDHADGWLRDTGPTILTRSDGARLAVDWRFDAWGGKYEDLRRDDALARVIAERSGIPRVRADTVLEGGAIETDGEGTILTTEQCLLNPNRGEDRTAEGLESVLAGMLGADRVLWLGEGIRGDDTDGHVDTIARFTAPGAVLACEQPDPTEADHAPLADNLGRLASMQDAAGRDLTVRTLPMPEPVTWDGQRLPASYANFYVGNDAVLCPVFGDAADDEAVQCLAQAFPRREVVALDARDLVVGFGACHCLTQQIPSPNR